MVIAMPTVLVAHKELAQEQKAGASRQMKFLKQRFSQKIIARGEGLRVYVVYRQVKRICVKPYDSSLQSYNHRHEHWVVVDGKGKSQLIKRFKFYPKDNQFRFFVKDV